MARDKAYAGRGAGSKSGTTTRKRGKKAATAAVSHQALQLAASEAAVTKARKCARAKGRIVEAQILAGQHIDGHDNDDSTVPETAVKSLANMADKCLHSR